VRLRSLIRVAYAGIGSRLAGRGLERWRVVRAADRLVVAYVRRSPVDVGGHRMHVDRRDSLHLAAKGVYEPLETSMVEREMREGGVALDLGAHIGYFTLLLARRAGEGGRVYAFEPDPENARLLRLNVALNGYDNVTVEEAAVGGESRSGYLARSSENSGDNQVGGPSSAENVVPVRVVRLDDYFAEYDGPLDFVKMDVQGYEGLALEGMRTLLARTKPRRVLAEFAPKWLREAGTDPATFLHALRGLEYELFVAGRDAVRFTPADDEALLSLEDGAFVNLWAVAG
jgi:FkbM family methyltransferase